MGSEIQFCSYCSNLLYPKEDREHKQLIFLCRSCDHLRYADPYSATQNCVDRLNYNFRSKEDVNSYIAQGLGHDPTLPRAPDWKCPKCPQTGAVYFQLPERVADDAMTLVFVCTNCTFYQVKGKEIQDTEKADPLEADNETEPGRETMLPSRDDADVAHKEDARSSGLNARSNTFFSPSVGVHDSDYGGHDRKEVTKQEAAQDHGRHPTLTDEGFLAEDVNYTDDDDDNLDALGLGGSDDEVDRDFDRLEDEDTDGLKECDTTHALRPSEESDSAATQSEVKLPYSEMLDHDAPPLDEEEDTEEKVSTYGALAKSP